MNYLNVLPVENKKQSKSAYNNLSVKVEVQESYFLSKLNRVVG